jgi:hypothetical protein
MTVLVATGPTASRAADTTDTAPVAAAAVCTLTREMTEGPYYLDGHDEPDSGTFLRGGVLTDSRGSPPSPRSTRAGTSAAVCTSNVNVTLTSDGSFTGGTELHTGQLFFDERVVRGTVLAEYGASAPTLTALGNSPSAGYSGTLTLGFER